MRWISLVYLFCCVVWAGCRGPVCTTVFSGDQIRKFTTVDPEDFEILPRDQTYFQVIPDQHAGEYHIELNIGGQHVLTVVDTGSSNLIVRKQDITTKNDHFLQQSFSISYGSGNGLAQKYQDTVGLSCGGRDVQYTFGVLEHNNNLPPIFGLAYPSIAQPGSPQMPLTPLFDQMLREHPGALTDIFGILFCGHKSGDAVVLGGPLPGVNQGDLTYVPILHQSYYVVDARYMQVLDYRQVKGKWEEHKGATTPIGDFQRFNPSENLGRGGGIQTIIDSGTTMNVFPPEIYRTAINILKSVNESKRLGIPNGFWEAKAGSEEYSIAVSAEAIRQLPKFQIVVLGMNGELVTLDLEPDTYLKQLSAGERTSSFRKTDSINILGQAFMEGYYVEHDRVSEPNRLGFLKNTNLCR